MCGDQQLLQVEAEKVSLSMQEGLSFGTEEAATLSLGCVFEVGLAAHTRYESVRVEVVLFGGRGKPLFRDACDADLSFYDDHGRLNGDVTFSVPRAVVVEAEQVQLRFLARVLVQSPPVVVSLPR